VVDLGEPGEHDHRERKTWVITFNTGQSKFVSLNAK